MVADAPTPESADDARETTHEPPAEQIHGHTVRLSGGQRVVFPDRGDYLALIKALHDDGYLMVVDLTAVDYLTYPVARDLPEGVRPERFEVVVNLLNHRERTRLRLRVQVPESEPELPTLWHLYPGTEAMEREAFDMFGVQFADHPDLTRILMPEDWVGHPLRKDFDSGRIPVQFKDAPVTR